MGEAATLVEPDFSGWATKAGIKCTDGRTITAQAFEHMDGVTVPLVWQHGHESVENVLGHAVLTAKPEGMWSEGFFNDTPGGLTAKAIVQHGDVKSLSIWANGLVEKAKQVFHGQIRELSLVLSGANPGATIENVAIRHSDGDSTVLPDEAIIQMGVPLEDGDIKHATATTTKDKTKDDETVADIFEGMTEEQKNAAYFVIGEALKAAGVSDEALAQSGLGDKDGSQTGAPNNEMTGGPNGDPANDKSGDQSGDNLEHKDKEGSNMTRNVFENGKGSSATDAGNGPTLTHAQLGEFLGKATTTAKRGGTLKEAMLAHAVEYGIENIDVLFPEAKAINTLPELVARRMEWVNVVLNGVRKSPLSRIKTVSADITHDQARAKGYVKGTLKKEEWFGLAKRVTTPTTIYKKQKLDRDDIIDIVDLDVVAFLKGEMRVMLDEEIARAVLLGDGREVDDEDKIPEGNIRPIAHDDDFFTHKVVLAANIGGEALVEQIQRARTKYRGSGNPTLFLTEELLTDMLLAKDKMARRLYASVEDLRVVLRVGAIQTVDAMEDQTADGGDLLAVLVNLSDYTIGADRGGNVAMFDDFDIDYNQYKYLIETRISGALTKFKSAQAFVRSAGQLVALTVPGFNGDTGVVTIPAAPGVTYYNADTNEVLATGDQPPLVQGGQIEVLAEPNTGYYFAHNTDRTWTFTRAL